MTSTITEQKNSCAICYDDRVLSNNSLVVLHTVKSSTGANIDHIFHENCINKWLAYKQECPICRYRIENEEDNSPPVESMDYSFSARPSFVPYVPLQREPAITTLPFSGFTKWVFSNCCLPLVNAQTSTNTP